MKLLLMSLMISGASQWMMSVVAMADDGDVVKKHVVTVTNGDGAVAGGKVIVLRGGEGTGCYTGEPCDAGDDGPCLKHKVIMKTVGGPDGDGNVNVWRSADGQSFTFSGDDDAHMVFVSDPSGAGDGRSDAVRVLRAAKDAGGADHGWLGVSITTVPESLAAQLNLEGEGVVVQNVVDGSPADQAGLLAHDVILSVDGKTVEDDAMGLVAAMKSRKPGDVVSLVVLRDGREKSMDVTLGSRAESGAALAWKFEVAPDADIEEQIHTFGKMLRKDADGNWAMENLGELDELKNLPEHIRMMLPKSGNRTVQVFANGENQRIRTKVQKDGNVIIIEQEGDGEINVTRVDDQGVETTATYADGDALRDADEEAYDIYASSANSNTFHFDADGADGEDSDGKFDFKFDIDPKHFGGDLGTWEVNIEKSLDAAREAHDHAMQELHHLMAEMKDGNGFTFKPGGLSFFGKDDGTGKPHAMRFGVFGKPKHTFELQADGSIEVRIRKGDSELLRKYADEADLADRDPKLYEKYEKLRAAEDDE